MPPPPRANTTGWSHAAGALAAYNAGEGKVDEWSRAAADRGETFRVADHIPFPEVLEARADYRREYARELGL
jgi:soluble lytic murein transglycosylase